MSEAVKREIEKLRAELDRHNTLYYVDAAPEISDEQFDGLLKRLQQLEEKHRLVSFISGCSLSQPAGDVLTVHAP